MPWKKGASVIGAAVVFIAMSATAASAQPRVPDSGMSALEGAIGLWLPENPLDSAVTLQGGYQFFVSPRVGVRWTLGWANPGFMGGDASLRQVRTGADLIYNWEGGRFHPFVGFGGGAYFVQQRVEGQAFGPSGTRGGINLLGGVEYFTSRRMSVKGEAAYHWVSQGTPAVLPWSPSGLTLTVGVRRYF